MEAYATCCSFQRRVYNIFINQVKLRIVSFYPALFQFPVENITIYLYIFQHESQHFIDLQQF